MPPWFKESENDTKLSQNVLIKINIWDRFLMNKFKIIYRFEILDLFTIFITRSQKKDTTKHTKFHSPKFPFIPNFSTSIENDLYPVPQ